MAAALGLVILDKPISAREKKIRSKRSKRIAPIIPQSAPEKPAANIVERTIRFRLPDFVENSVAVRRANDALVTLSALVLAFSLS